MSAARLRVAARLLVIVVLLLPLAFVLAGAARTQRIRSWCLMPSRRSRGSTT